MSPGGRALATMDHRRWMFEQPSESITQIALGCPDFARQLFRLGVWFDLTQNTAWRLPFFLRSGSGDQSSLAYFLRTDSRRKSGIFHWCCVVQCRTPGMDSGDAHVDAAVHVEIGRLAGANGLGKVVAGEKVSAAVASASGLGMVHGGSWDCTLFRLDRSCAFPTAHTTRAAAVCRRGGSFPSRPCCRGCGRSCRGRAALRAAISSLRRYPFG